MKWKGHDTLMHWGWKYVDWGTHGRVTASGKTEVCARTKDQIFHF